MGALGDEDNHSTLLNGPAAVQWLLRAPQPWKYLFGSNCWRLSVRNLPRQPEKTTFCFFLGKEMPVMEKVPKSILASLHEMLCLSTMTFFQGPPPQRPIQEDLFSQEVAVCQEGGRRRRARSLRGSVVGSAIVQHLRDYPSVSLVHLFDYP